MRFNKKKVLALTGAIANLSFTCAVAGVATYAWFTSIESATSDGMTIISSLEHIRLDYVILKYDDNLKEGIATGVNDASEFILPEYDQYIKERNKYANLIVRANLVFPDPIDTSETEIKIDITKAVESSLKALDEGDPDDPDDDALLIQKLTSNVVQFKTIVTSYTLADGENTVVPINVGIQETQGGYASVYDAEYKTAVDYFKSRNTPTTFISLMNNQPVDPMNGNVITLVPELNNVGVVKSAVVYLECSYNELLVDGFFEDHQNESLSNLVGDIERIDFGIHKFTGSTFGAIATGRYVRMDSAGSSYDGLYLDSYVSSTEQYILDGSKTTGSEVLEDVENNGINVDENQKTISNYISNNQNSVYSANTIDNSALTYSRAKGTYKSHNGHYVGNPSDTDGILSSSNASAMRNNVTYQNNSYNAIIKPIEQDGMQLQYDTEDSKFAYYGATKNDINLYKYCENDPIEATLTGFQMTAPQGLDATYSLGEYFSLKGVNCIATYTRNNPNGEGTIDFTINVTNICVYEMEDIELIPEQTSFSFAGQQTVTVTYADRGVTYVRSFDLTIIADTILELEITNSPAKTLYRIDENFDISDLVVVGTFAVAGEIEVLPSEYQCKVGNTILAANEPIRISGDDLEVKVVYTGGAGKPAGYVDPTFTITVKAYVYDPVSVPTHFEINDQPYTITFNYNAALTWTIGGTPGSLSFDANNDVTSETTSYNGSGYQTLEGTITVYPKLEGRATLTVQVTGTNYSRTYNIEIGDPPLEVTFTAGEDIDPNATGVGNAGSLTKEGITVSSGSCHMATNYNNYRFYKSSDITFSSTTHVIKKIEFTFSGGANSDGNPANLSSTGYNNVTGVWTGTSSTVVFTLSAASWMTSIKVYYKDIVVPDVVSLSVFDEDGTTPISSPFTIDGGSVHETTWTPIAVVTYDDNSTDNDVTWAKSNDANDTITLNTATGEISFNKISGSVTITVTTNRTTSSDDTLSQTFTLTWLHFTRELVSISVDTDTGPTQFALNASFVRAPVTAYYNDGESEIVTNACSFSSPNMTLEKRQTVTVSYTYGGETRTTSYQITVGNPPQLVESTVTIDFDEGGNCSSTSGTFVGVDFSCIKNSASTPAYNANDHDLRLYCHAASGNGNAASLETQNGYTIKQVVINATSGYTPTVKYSSDGGAEATGTWNETTMTISGLEAETSFVFRNANTGDNVQLRIKSIVITLETEATARVNSVTVSDDSLLFDLNSANITAQLTATVNVSYGASQAVTWSSDDDTVATVSSTGLVTAVGVGQATITVTSDFDNTKYDTCTVNVYDSSQSGNPVTKTMTTFTAISGNVDNDPNVSYLAEKGGAGTAPAIYNDQIRIYQNGGLLTITANNGKTLSEVIVGSSNATTIQYSVDGGNTWSNNISIASGGNGTATISNLSGTTVIIKCMGSDKNSRLNVNYLSVTYV